MSNVERGGSNLEIRDFVVLDEGENVNVKGITLPPFFSFGAIREILSQIVWGVESENRGIAFFPEGSDESKARFLSTRELREYRSISYHERMAFLDQDARQIKSASTVMIIKPE